MYKIKIIKVKVNQIFIRNLGQWKFLIVILKMGKSNILIFNKEFLGNLWKKENWGWKKKIMNYLKAK